MGDTIQEETRNGAHLRKLIKDTNLTNINETNKTRGLWTRQQRTDPNKKSIIDYTLTTEKITKNVEECLIDEQGTFRLKADKESDHNTIITRFSTKIPNITKKTKRWKLNNNNTGWEKYNTEINNRAEELKNMSYQQYANEIRKILKKTIGEKTITTGRRRKRENPEVNQARAKMKEAKKKYEESIDLRDETKIKHNLDNLIKEQTNLRNTILQQETARTKNELMKMTNEGGTNSNSFWRHRANIMGKQNKDEYDTIDEKGNLILDPEKAKEHIANYYEDLY